MSYVLVEFGYDAEQWTVVDANPRDGLRSLRLAADRLGGAIEQLLVLPEDREVVGLCRMPATVRVEEFSRVVSEYGQLNAGTPTPKSFNAILLTPVDLATERARGPGHVIVDDVRPFVPLAPNVLLKPLFLQAPPTISAASAMVWEGERNKVWFEKEPDLPCWTGSTLKIVTIAAALWALKNGSVGLDDVIAYSEKAVAQGCRCIGEYAMNPPPPTDLAYDFREYASVGEQSSLEEALYGVAMSAAQPTVAVAEHVASAYLLCSKAPAQNWAESTMREILFVKKLMYVAAAEAGITNSVFANEHGGDQPIDPAAFPAPPKSPSRDFVKMWHHFATTYPQFLKFLGFRTYQHTTYTPPTSDTPPYAKTYAFSRINPYYPRLEGDKNGGVTPAGEPTYGSLVGSSKRVGRTITFNLMQADAGQEFAEARELLEWGFSRVFNPDNQGSSGETFQILDHAIACAAADRAISAWVTPSGGFRLTTWNVAENPIEALWSMPHRPPEGDPVGDEQVDVIYLGDVTPLAAVPKRVFVTAFLKNAKITLSSWHLRNDDSLDALDTNELDTGEGRFIALLRLSSTRLVTARRGLDGNLHLSVWTVDKEGLLTRVASDSAEAVKEVALAPSAVRPAGFVTAVRLTTNRLKLIAWEVHDDGSVSRFGDSGSAGPLVTGISVAALETTTPVSQFATSGADFINTAIASNTAGVRVDLWQIGPSEGSAAIVPVGTMGPYPGDVAETKLTPLHPGGLLLVMRDAGVLRLIPLEYDGVFLTDGGDPNLLKLGHASAGFGSLIRIAEAPTTLAAGQYVTAVRRASEKMELISWEVGRL